MTKQARNWKGIWFKITTEESGEKGWKQLFNASGLVDAWIASISFSEIDRRKLP